VGGGVAKVEGARAQYRAAKPVPKDLGIDFAREFRVGYFGPEALLMTMQGTADARVAAGTADMRTARILGLPKRTWRDALRTSPAEPTISEAPILEQDKMTAVGGWAEPFPTTPLKLARCQNVVFLTARQDYQLISDLGTQVGGDGQRYVEETKKQGFADADAVWCADWANAAPLEVLSLPGTYKLTERTFRTTLESDRPFFLQRDSLAQRPTTPRPTCEKKS
jgi:hypothetical protein